MEVRKLALTGSESPTITPDSPVVVTLKVLYSYPGMPTEDQGIRGRNEMLRTSFREYETRIRDQFAQMFSSAGFDVKRDIAGVLLNRWGHAYLRPVESPSQIRILQALWIIGFPFWKQSGRWGRFWIRS
jgi:spermidine dehydrogenase